MYNIKYDDNRFYIDDLAEITFIEEKDHIIINHTYVSEDLRGQGIALKLLNEVINYSKNNNKKIIPLCSYAKKVMTNEKYKELLYKR